MGNFRPPEPISPLHDLGVFDCGKEPLDTFLKLHALDKQRAMLSRTYVVCDDSKVVGYYTLAHISVTTEESPKKMARGMPRTIPAMLMARLAVDQSAHGRGLGRSMFTDGIRRTWAVMNAGPAPVRLFVVDAKDDDARAFYERFDMTASPLDPMRLFLSYKTLASIFDSPDEPIQTYLATCNLPADLPS